MKHIFVINPLSFPVQALLDKVLKEIRDCFAEREDEYCIYSSRYPRDAIGYIRKQVKKIGTEETIRVYAVGGDGILFDCLNGIVGLPNTELAIVPYGNANNMVRVFGESKNTLFRDIRLQASAPVIPADIISCGNNYALNFCILGIETDVVINVAEMYGRIRQRLGKFQWLGSILHGVLSYMCALRSVCNKKLLTQLYSITIDGKDFSGVYGNINIANGSCSGNNKSEVITAMPNDGMLDVLLFQCPSTLKAMALIGSYIKGHFNWFPKQFFWERAQRIKIRSLEPLLVNLDGEVFIDTYLRVEIVPQGVKLAAPGGVDFVRRMET